VACLENSLIEKLLSRGKRKNNYRAKTGRLLTQKAEGIEARMFQWQLLFNAAISMK
jgi:hypothetical protein